MGYIPQDAKWYLADIVEQISVEGDSRNVVHTNLVLVRADSPEEAYQKALDLGMAAEQSFENPQGNLVTIHFRGLRDLNVIHDDLEHGAELSFQEELGMEEAEIAEWVRPKEELGVFRRIIPSKGPEFGAREILEEIDKEFPHLPPGRPNLPT